MRGATPLYAACINGFAGIVKLLLCQDGIAVNKETDEDGSEATPLFSACTSGHVEVVKLLLAHANINVNKGDICQHETPLFIACQLGRTEITRLLLAHDGIDVNPPPTLEERSTPLHAAAWNGNLVEAQLLVLYGADVTATEYDGVTPERSASQNNQKLLKEWLSVTFTWSQLRVAAGCRHFKEAADALRRGTDALFCFFLVVGACVCLFFSFLFFLEGGGWGGPRLQCAIQVYVDLCAIPMACTIPSKKA